MPIPHHFTFSFRSIAYPIFFFYVLLICSACSSLKQTSSGSPPLSQSDTLRGMFYNVENLFDTVKDTAKDDDDFLPGSDKEWTKARYQRKLKDLASVIAAAVQDRKFAFLGLAEIENEKVLSDLIHEPAIDEYPLSIIHHESPDERGIDVAFIYNDKLLDPISHRAIPVTFPFDTSDATRDILHVKAWIANMDTMHLFVNHWPGRSGGIEQSAPYRIEAAQTLRNKVNSIKDTNEAAEILIMGDFNDEPRNESIRDVLEAHTHISEQNQFYLYNLMSRFLETTTSGTYNYKGDWNLLDQMMVSSPAFSRTDGVHVVPESAGIYRAPWLLYEKENGQKVPNRTYGGASYYGGYSDHLPLFVDLMIYRAANPK